MTTEDYSKKISEAMKKSHAKMSDEQKAEISAKKSKSMKIFWDKIRELKANQE